MNNVATELLNMEMCVDHHQDTIHDNHGYIKLAYEQMIIVPTFSLVKINKQKRFNQK